MRSLRLSESPKAYTIGVLLTNVTLGKVFRAVAQSRRNSSVLVGSRFG